MKEIMAIIRINKINPTKKALADVGIKLFQEHYVDSKRSVKREVKAR